MPIFDGVRYWLAESLPHERRVLNSNYLDLNGGRAADSISHATHIITNTNQFEGWRRVEDGVIDAVVVTETWIDRSIILGKAQPSQFYSANPAMVFSGIVACATDMTAPDLEVMSAGITALGGQWRTGLTRDVTHLFALGPGSDKYETAMHFQADTHMKVVLPHWFDDAIKLGVGGLPTAGYEWPDPKYLRSDPNEEGGADGEAAGGKKGGTRKSQLSGDKKKLFQSVGWTEAPPPPEAMKDVWGGRKILLSLSLELSGGRREAVEAGIKRAGGVVVAYKKREGDGEPEEELKKVAGTAILVTRYRHGAAYLQALRMGKTIGTLAWLFHVESTGVLSPPTDQLLHYPIPKRPITGFTAHKITVTNYTGESREYLKKLILAMGAEFTPNMSGANTVVIAAYISGLKTTKALNWSIPIVNHVWLEDCFIQWKTLSVGVAKYIDFPPGTDFAMILGERGPGRIVLGDLEREEELLAGEGSGEREEEVEGEEKEKEKEKELVAIEVNGVKVMAPKWQEGLPTATGTPKDKQDAKKMKNKNKPGSGEQPVGTATSTKDAREVEEAVGNFDGNGDAMMDVDEDAGALDNGGVSPLRARKGNKKARKSRDGDEEEEGGDKIERPKSRLIRRAGGSKEAEKEVTKVKAKEKDGGEPGSSSKGKGKQRAIILPDLDTSSDEFNLEAVIKVKPAAKARGKPFPLPVDTDEDEEVAAPKKPARTHASNGKDKEVDIVSPAWTPKRVVSVVLPSNSGSKKKPGPTRTESLRVAADEAPSYTTKRARPAKWNGPVPDSHSGGRLSLDGDSVTPASLPSKRTAAIKATNHLHNVAMPDLMSFAQEKKRGFKGKDSDRISDRSREMSAGKGRKRPSDGSMDRPSSDEEVVGRKKQKISAGGSKKKRIEATSDDESEVEIRPRKAAKMVRIVSYDGGSDNDLHENVEKGKRLMDKSRMSKTDPNTVKLMTTQVSLSDDVVKNLTRIGIRFTSRPSECTHLVVSQLVRTEKFLCAMAVAPFILKEGWALESASAKYLLPEEKYMLQDSKNEQKYSFKLSDALRRAKAVGGRLFDQNIFYVTPKVPVDAKLLKNVVNAGGGQVLTATPTVRILKANENRHVVSCPADASIWRPLAENGFTIYSPELLLTGALRQEIDWEDDANKVPGSF